MEIEQIIIKLDNGNDFIINLTGDIKKNIENIFEQIYANKDIIKVRRLSNNADIKRVRNVDHIKKLPMKFILDEDLDTRLYIFGNYDSIQVSFNKHYLNITKDYAFIKIKDQNNNIVDIRSFLSLAFMTCEFIPRGNGEILYLNNDRLKIDRRVNESRINIETI